MQFQSSGHLGRQTESFKFANKQWSRKKMVLFLALGNLGLTNLAIAGSDPLPPAATRERLVAFTPPATKSTAHSAISLSIRLGRDVNPLTLKITDNGVDITNAFQVNQCSSTPCSVSGVLKQDAEMQSGWNYLKAGVRTPTGAAGSASLRFYSRRPNLQDPTNPIGPPSYFVHVAMSPTDGIEVDYTPENGIGEHFYPGDDHQCSSPGSFTIIDLDRSTLAWRASTCFNNGTADNGALQDYLQTLTESDLLLASTGPGDALGALNLSLIGGTDFTQPNSPQAYSYSIIGYGKATPGIATESYNTSSSAPWHGLTGQLINTSSIITGHVFAFRPTDPVGFAVLTGRTASVTIGNVKDFPVGSGTPPNQTVPSGFSSVTYSSGSTQNGGVWLLVLDRYTLAEVSSTTFPANDSAADPYLQSKNIDAALASLDSSKICFLVTLDGSVSTFNIPTNSTGVGYQDMLSRIQQAGVSPYAFDRMSQPLLLPNRQFAMVGIPNNFRPQGTACTGFPNNSTQVCGSNQDQWFSSIADSQQGEQGPLKGTLARNKAFLYSPQSVAPFDPASLGSNPSADDLLADGLGLAIGSAPHVAWPLQDTSGHLNAYKYLSTTLISKDFYGNGICEAEPASVCTDIRYYYTNDEAPSIATGTDPSIIPYPGDSIANMNGFSQDDWTAATTQLAYEKAYLADVLAYQTRLTSINEASLQNIGAQLQAAATQVANDLNQATGIPLSGTKQSPLALTTDVLDTVGSALGAASIICPPCGVVGGIMNAAGGILAIAKDAQKGATPIPDPYVNQLGDLLAKEDGTASAAAGNFNYDLGTSTGVFFDGVYSDWFKLQTIALMAVNPSATAWNYQDSSDNGIQAVVGPRMLATVRRNFYLQTANQYFQTYSLFNVPSYVSDSEAQNKEGLSNLKSFSWSKRVTLGGGVGNFSDYNFVVLKNNPKSSWGDAFGNALMGAPSATDGSGNLNLNQNLLYDSGIFPIVKSSSY